MKKYTFLVFHREYEHFLEQLRRAGVVHVEEKSEGVADNEQLQESLSLLSQIRATIALMETELKSDEVSVNDANGNIQSLMQHFAQLREQRQAIEQQIAALQQEAKRMAVWGNFSNSKLEELSKAGYKLQFFTCSESKYDPEWETLYNAFIVAQDKSTLYFVCVGKQNEAFDLGDIEEIRLSDKNQAELEAEISTLQATLTSKQAEIENWVAQNIASVRNEANRVQHEIDWQRVNLSTTNLAENRLKMIEGYCPIDNVEELEKMLNAEKIYFTSQDPTEEDNTPIKLHNNRFTAMFECLTGMYGWPVYGEADPTPILAPFFLLFFALCMGDAGYGILLILFGILTLKKKINIAMFEGLGPIITTLGVGTLVVGFFLGTFFGIDLYAASWVPDALKSVMIKGEVMGYDIQMVMALCIGVFHICLAMTVKAVIYTRRFGFKANISTWGWLLLILGGLIIGILALANVFSAQIAKWALIVVGAISALGIYIFNTPGRNPLINIGAGLWDTYNMATGILGDVLSYIRLYALGLAGGMLGAAFNNLASMVLGESPTWQWLFFVLILLIGHLLNLAMSALGAFVHPLRLSFVEYFKNSGYEGKGQLYKPFAE